MIHFRFEDPWLLSFLLVIPLIVFLYIKKYGGNRVKFSSINNLKKLKKSKSLYLRHILILLRAFALVLLILGLARPQSGTKLIERTTEGIDIILTVDTSGSMQALDFKLEGDRVDRLTVVKDVVKKFIKKRENDRIGMVVFGQEAFTQCPLTMDYGILLSFLDQAKIGMAGESTAVGSALGVSVKRLKDLKAKSRVIILLTDGRNNSGRIDPKTAAELAKKFNVKVYAIGVGTEGEVPFLVEHPLFGKRYAYDRVDLDKETLKMIADTTGGKFYTASDTKALEDIYGEIDKLEKTKVEVKEYMEFNELFSWFVIPALCLILLEVVLANTRFRKIP
ncbi:MAG: VWA domain-containing protein [bacterium]